jgi:hypothetical protein
MLARLCCCLWDRGNPEERLPLMSQSASNPNRGHAGYEAKGHESVLSKPGIGESFLGEDLEDIIRKLSSDDALDPEQEAKYEDLLKGIED